MGLTRQILKTNFAALQVLQYVHDFESFSVAANRLNLSQSTVSYTVARLRIIFRDPLFAREGNRVVPTRRCRVIAAYISSMLAELEGLAVETTFSPSHAQGSVVISCNHYERMTILPKFIHQIRKEAPNLQLKFMTSRSVGEEQLKRGECDLLIGLAEPKSDQIFTRKLCSDSYVYVMDRANPLAMGKLGIEELKKANHLVIRFAGNWQPLYLDILRTHGVHLNPMVELSDYGNVEACLMGSDLVACLPGQIAATLDKSLLKIASPVSVSFEISLFWTVRTHHSKLHGWIRQALVQSAHKAASPRLTGG